jgi:sugar-specific transcriptional regulator TrmB
MRRWVGVFIVGVIVGGLSGMALYHSYLEKEMSETIAPQESADELQETVKTVLEKNEKLSRENLDLKTRLSSLTLITPAPKENIVVETIPNRLYFDKVHSVFTWARRTIYVIMYSMAQYLEYPLGHEARLLSALIDARKRGVEVRVLLESGVNDDLAHQNRQTGDYLSKFGITVKFDSRGITTHDKLIIVDSKIVVVGSTNWTYHAIDENNEASVVIYSESVGLKFQKYFLELWRKYMV